MGKDNAIFFVVFALTFVAELPDKTAFATMFLAARNRPGAVMLGACLAFVVQSVIAILFGALMGMIPRRIVLGLTGIIFLALAIAMWRRHKTTEESPDSPDFAGFWAQAGTAFMAIFIAEWGDLTQISTAALTARYGHPITVLTAAILALWSATALAVWLGDHLGRTVHPRTLDLVSSIVFACVGLGFTLRAMH